jgi:hypothetical protein
VLTSPRPFERHLREAIALNRVRAGPYAALSGGRSRLVSESLIASERLLLPLARWFDGRAEPYHRAGIPVLEAVFVPMTGLGPVERRAPLPGPGVGRHAGARARASRAVGQALARGDVARARAAVEAALARLSCPAVDGMRRHVLESARRVLTVAGPLGRLAVARRLPPPEPLLHRLARLHVWSLPAADRLDDLALPLQLQGVPILVHDLPPIPAWPDGWPAEGTAERSAAAGEAGEQ